MGKIVLKTEQKGAKNGPKMQKNRLQIQQRPDLPSKQS